MTFGTSRSHVNINSSVAFKHLRWWTRIARSVQRLAVGWTAGDRIPVRARYSAPAQTDVEDHPASYIGGTGSLFCG